MTEKEPKKPGPDPDTVTGEGDWKDAVSDALKIKKPKDGWPRTEEKGNQSA